jgi:hypothetical protein
LIIQQLTIGTPIALKEACDHTVCSRLRNLMGGRMLRS